MDSDPGRQELQKPVGLDKAQSTWLGKSCTCGVAAGSRCGWLLGAGAGASLKPGSTWEVECNPQLTLAAFMFHWGEPECGGEIPLQKQDTFVKLENL